MARKYVPKAPTKDEEADVDQTFVVYRSSVKRDADGNETPVFSRVTSEEYAKAGL